METWETYYNYVGSFKEVTIHISLMCLVTISLVKTNHHCYTSMASSYPVFNSLIGLSLPTSGQWFLNSSQSKYVHGNSSQSKYIHGIRSTIHICLVSPILVMYVID